MRLERPLEIVDAHAEGEASRVVIGGMPEIPGDSMFDKRGHIAEHLDSLRRLLLFEPRGAVTLCADIVFPSNHPRADWGYVIIEPTDYPAMSGTNTINTATVLLETGMVPMVEPETRFALEAPAGIIEVVARCKDGKCTSVTFRNQPSFVVEQRTPVTVPELGVVEIDVAFGGAFFAFVDAGRYGFDIVPSEARELARLGQLVTSAAAAQVEAKHPTYPGLGGVTFTTWYAKPRRGGDYRNANVLSPGRIDRSACGTGTSARMAVLHARGELSVQRDFVSESILDSRFVGRIEEVVELHGISAIVPSITGRSWVYARGSLAVDTTDPYPQGFSLADAWGVGGPDGLAATGRRIQ
jgi:proline racemase